MEPQPTPTEDRMRRCTYQSAFERPLKRQRQIAPSSIFDHLPLSENRPYTPFDPLPQGGCAPLIPADLTISQYRVRISSLVSCPSYSVTLPQLDIPPRTQGASPSSAPATVANNAGTQSSTSPATSSVGIPGNNGSKLSEHLLGGNSKISTSPSRRAHLLSNDMELKRRHTPQPVVNSKQKLIPCPYELCQKTFSRNSNLKGKNCISMS